MGRGTRQPPGRPARALTRLRRVALRDAFLSELKLSPHTPTLAGRELGRRVGGAGSGATNPRPVPASGVSFWLLGSAS